MILLCANRAGRTRFVSLSAAIAFLAASAAATPADIGIAARYPGDKNIGSDPDVILADDFEPYNVPNDLTAKWKVSGVNSGNVIISTGEHYAGAKSIEFDLPISTVEHGYGIKKLLSPSYDTLYHRAYMKWDAGYNVNSSNHNGICMKGGDNPMTGQAPTGYDFFVLLVQNNDVKGEGPPGWLHNYVYWPEQAQQWGDHWYPNGAGFPTTGHPNFKPLPNFLPERDRWYCYEMMTRLNTSGNNNGEVKVWVDGKVVADWTDLVIRKVDTLKIDETYIGLHAIKSERLNKKWYDNVVIAKSYIGPMTPLTSPTPSPTVSPTPTPTPTLTPTPTPSPTPTPTPPFGTPTPTPNPTPPFGTPTPPPSPTPTAAAQLQNISGRLLIQTGNNVGIAGFVVGGTEPKKLLIRGLGPTLAQFSVTGVMQNPTLELHDGSGSLITTNDNWKDTQQAEITATQLAPPADAEAAILATLRPGAYTAIETGARGGTGVGLIEVYDVDPLAASRLINISTRGLVQTGSNVLIAGCSLAGGSGSNDVVVRALGPSLVPFGVNNALPDPVVTLYDSNANVITANDNWKDSQQNAIANTGLQPPNDLDAAISITLAAGNYTAVVTGKDGSTGVALVEVYASH